MRKPSEKIELSYPGLLDGAVYSIPQGVNIFSIPDPSYHAPIRIDIEVGPQVESPEIPILEFTRRPYSNIFVLKD